MKRRTLAAAALLLGAVAASTLADRPSLGEAQGQFGAGKYRQALETISAVLTDRGRRVDPDTRYALLMLRGECMLRLRQSRLAAEAFAGAALVSKDDAVLAKQAAAEASASVTRASGELAYAPHAAGGSPIDIIPDEGRKRAMVAMLEDRLRDIEPRAKEAVTGSSLQPLQRLVPDVCEAYWLELAGTGKADRTLALGKQIGERARQLIRPRVEELRARVAELVALEAEPVPPAAGAPEAAPFTRRGLNESERAELRAAAEEIAKLTELAYEGRKLARRLGGAADAWDAIVADTAEAGQAARRALG